MRRTLSAIFIVLSIVTAFAAFGVPVNTSWTYQGQLQRSGAAYTGTCNFQFSLWDALSAGTQQGSTQSINGVSVVNGLFTVVLDFSNAGTGAQPFKGDARWLGTSVQCTGDGGFTPLDPRQALTAAPYALSLMPGATVNGGPAVGASLNINNFQGGVGVFATGVPGVYGISDNGYGVVGQSTDADSAGVFGTNFNGTGVWGESSAGDAIFGRNTGAGYAGRFIGPVSVEGGQLSVSVNSSAAIVGDGPIGISGTTNTNPGVGVFGSGVETNSMGVYGKNTRGVAVWGESLGSGSAIFGRNSSTGLAGQFSGPVLIQGDLTVNGMLVKQSGSFRIDHPLDPANKFLSHSFVESPDMKNIYDGNVTTDATGSAIVTLPAYFETLNRDYRYQLTVLGQFAQAIVSRKIAGNSFEIRTDKPGIEVSWQVTGIRQDAYARVNPIVVEESKPTQDQGMYLFPAGFGAGEEKQIGYRSRPTAPETEQKVTKKAN
jgi:hypothetical protein